MKFQETLVLFACMGFDSMSAFETGLMWSVYNDMEDVFMEFLEYVPPDQAHKKVYSYKLLILMLQIGGYIDTAFKEMAIYTKFDGNAKCEAIRDKVAKEEIVRISLFREAFEPIYNLSSKTVVMKSPKLFASPPTLIDRFNPFLEFRKNKAPKWWKAYNKVKHNWTKNLKKANLENTFEALGGAFLLNVIHEPSLLELARRGIVSAFRGRTLGHAQFHFSGELLTRLIKREQPLDENEVIMVDTQLFRWRFV